MRLEQVRVCRVVLDAPATQEQLQLFLSRPLLPLRGLLDGERLVRLPGDGEHFTYASRPYRVVGWTLQPRVQLQASWELPQLRITQTVCRVQGLGAWQDQLRFGLEAILRPVQQNDGCVLEAEATVSAELPAAAVTMAAPMLRLGLSQLLDRLERRCQRGLRRKAEAWLQRAA